MNVLSLFDGMSGGQVALKEIGFSNINYYASEIKPHAIKVTQLNFPNTVQLGDISKLSYKNGYLHSENGTFYIGKVDLLIGGSPCKNLSFINKHDRSGLNGEKSKLFYEFHRLFKEVSPSNFLLENVASMKNVDRDIIDKMMGVKHVKINSSLLTAQTRNRYYWTNLTIEEIADKEISLKDVIDYEAAPEEKWTDKKLKFIEKKLASNSRMYVKIDGDKSIPITARGYQAWNSQFVTGKYGVRDLTINEFKKLQTIPTWYSFGDLKKSKITDLIGDGWTIDVIIHILRSIKI